MSLHYKKGRQDGIYNRKMSNIIRYITAIILTAVTLTAPAQEEAHIDTARYQYVDGQENELSNCSTLIDDGDITDTVCVSVLTCSPGEELYSRFGHTAIRVHLAKQYIDIVLNYGCFNYNSDNFVIKFLLGQTDYLLEGEAYNSFIRRYEKMGQSVTEQVLNTTPQEEEALIQLLRENLQPENQQYRYVWLYDNCTERARDVIEQAINGKVEYQRAGDSHTVRQLLRSCLTASAPWAMFGIDMILGEEIDAAPDRRVQMFLPHFFSDELRSAVIKRNGEKAVKMVKRENVVLESTTAEPEPLSVFLRPSCVFLFLLIAFVLIMAYEVSRARYLWGIDVTLHMLQGMAGILVSFLFFFSKHPGVDTNWLVIMFNPLWIAYAIWIARCQRKKVCNRLGIANMVLTTLFLVFMCISRQSFSTGMYFLVAALMLRACVQGHFMYHTQKDHRASQRRAKNM